MRVGYACLTVGVLNTNFKTFRKKNLNEKNLKSIIKHNLKALDNIIDYNIKNNIKLFRITSDLIPFGGGGYKWEEWFKKDFKKIGEKIKKNNIRVSMHPGQYTVLNSPHEEVVKNAVIELEYHAKVLSLLGVSNENKIILHIGGVYNDKESAMVRFIENYQKLNKDIKQRLVIENDEKNYNVEEVLYISNKLNIPVVFDNLHNQLNQSELGEVELIKKCVATWKKKDGTAKIHYSEQAEAKKNGAHSWHIDVEKFTNFVDKLTDDVDIMLEVKDKNLSALECNLVLLNKKN